MILTFLCAFAGVPDTYRESYQAEADGEIRRALTTLDTLPSDEKASYIHNLRRAWLLYLLGEHDASARAYDEASGVSPRALEPRLGKLLPLLAAHRWTEAERVASAILETSPDTTAARARRAWAYFNLGRYADAEKDYRYVLTRYPSDLEMQAGIAWCRLKRGDRDGARKEIDAVLRVAPDHPAANAALAAL